jgi:hypothetical protein
MHSIPRVHQVLSARLRRILPLVALAALLVAPGESAAQGTINGSFEVGNPVACDGSHLAGWVFTASVSAVSAHQEVGSGAVYSPTDGQCFALLETGVQNVYTQLSQPFSATAGSEISGDVFFDAGDYLPFNDSGQVLLLDLATNTSYTLFQSSVEAVGDFGFTAWTEFSFIIPADSSYQIIAQVKNVGDSGFHSFLGFDNFELTASITPELDSFVLFGAGTLALAGFAYRQRRKRQVA